MTDRRRHQSEPAGIRELRQEVRDLRRASAQPAPRVQPPKRDRPTPGRRRERTRRSPKSRRRFAFVVAVFLVVIVLAISGVFSGSKSFQPPSRSALAGLSMRGRIVAIADSQVGYSTDPGNSYCNKFSSFWHAGNAGCPSGELTEKWCADFAAWAWRRAGVAFSYGYDTDQLNAGAASFYTWGVAHGTWHPVQSAYTAQPGDVAVYGLTLGATPSAVHVAIVTAKTPSRQAPDVINGDGDRTGFSVVETGTAQLRADTGHGQNSQLAGYVSPA